MIHGWYGNIFSLEVGSEYPTIYKGFCFTYGTKNWYTCFQLRYQKLPKFNMEPKMMVSNTNLLFQGADYRIHVKLWEQSLLGCPLIFEQHLIERFEQKNKS